MAQLDENWVDDLENPESEHQRYRLRSGRYVIEEGDDGNWSVIPPDGLPLADGLNFETAKQMAEKHDGQARLAAEHRER